MNLCMVGIDFVHAPIEVREKVGFVRGKVQALLPRIAEAAGGAAAVLLATCNRTELYLHRADDLPLDALDVLAQAAGLDAAVYRPFSVTHSGQAAVRHLMAVAAGLESQIFGDEQIVTQVREAAALAQAANTTDSVLGTLFRRAVTAGKRVRTEVRLSGVPASAAEIGARRAETFFGTLAGRRAVVIGNGEMGRLAAAALRARGCAVTVTLRTYRHGETIVPAGCDTFPYDRRCEVIDGADLVVSATTSPHFTITAEETAKMKRPPALMIDLAVPRDIEKSAARHDKTVLWNLDDLGDFSDEHAPERAAAARILRDEEQQFYAWYDYRKALPVIDEIKDAAQARLRYDHAYAGLIEDRDLDGLTELAVQKTVDLLLGGLKGQLDAQKLGDCLAHIRKGSGR